MKFTRLERAAVTACAAVFLLATADGLGMTWVCPVSGPNSCSEQTATNERTISATTATPASQRSSGLLGLCSWDERAPDEQLAGLTMSVPFEHPSQQGIPCPVENGYTAKMTSRLDVPRESHRE